MTDEHGTYTVTIAPDYAALPQHYFVIAADPLDAVRIQPPQQYASWTDATTMYGELVAHNYQFPPGTKVYMVANRTVYPAGDDREYHYAMDLLAMQIGGSDGE